MITWTRWFAGVALLLACTPFYVVAASSLMAREEDQRRTLTGYQRELVNGAAGFIEGFSRTHGRLPGQQEFRGWMDSETLKGAKYDGVGFSYEPQPAHGWLWRRFGKAPPNAYVFEYWGGNAYYSFPSWSGHMSSVYVSDEQYFVLGAKWIDVFVFVVAGTLLFLGGVLIFRTGKGASDAR